MANNRTRTLFIAATLALTAAGAITACKQTIVPSDNDLTKVFQDNSKSFESAATQIMSEPNQTFTVYLQKGVEYPGSDKTPIKPQTKLLCEQTMRRSFALAVRRTGPSAQFVFFEGDQNGHFRSKSIVYDRDNFKDPRWNPKPEENATVRYSPVSELNKDTVGPIPKTVGGWRLEYRYDNAK